MSEDWAAEAAVAAAPAPAVAEMPEIMLFGRWSCDDVQVSDISLTVSFETRYNVVKSMQDAMDEMDILALVLHNSDFLDSQLVAS